MQSTDRTICGLLRAYLGSEFCVANLWIGCTILELPPNEVHKVLISGQSLDFSDSAAVFSENVHASPDCATTCCKNPSLPGSHMPQ